MSAKQKAKLAYREKCQRCGAEFITNNVRRLYCSTYCRRQAQNEARKAYRSENHEAEAAQQAFSPWTYDPWEVNDLDNAELVYSNSLHDGWTASRCGLTMCPDEAIGGPTACLTCTRYAGDKAAGVPHETAAPLPEKEAAQDAAPSLYGQEDRDEEQEAASGLLPSRKEIAKAKRRRRKRKHASVETVEQGAPSLQDVEGYQGEEQGEAAQSGAELGGSAGAGQEQKQDHDGAQKTEGGVTMDRKKEEGGSLEDIASEALRIITGERQEQYGTPERNFAVIASLWNAYLSGIDHSLTSADVASMMVLFKMARNMTGAGKHDTDVDMLGYALLGIQMRKAVKAA